MCSTVHNVCLLLTGQLRAPFPQSQSVVYSTPILLPGNGFTRKTASGKSTFLI